MALKAEEVYAILKKQIQSGGATPEQIQQAVDNYLTENPVQPGATVEQAAQIEKNKTDISELSEENGVLQKSLEKCENALTEEKQIVSIEQHENSLIYKDGEVQTGWDGFTAKFFDVSNINCIVINNGVSWKGTYPVVTEFDSEGNVLSYYDGGSIPPDQKTNYNDYLYRISNTKTVKIGINGKSSLTVSKPVYGDIDYLKIKESLKFFDSQKNKRYSHCVKKPYVFNEKTSDIFGDSIARGWVHWDSETYPITENNWVKLFCDKVGMTYNNHAVGGSTSENVISQINSVSEYGDYAFFGFGVNDWQRAVSLDAFRSNMKTICDHLKENFKGIDIIFITPINEAGIIPQQTPIAELQDYRNIISEVAMEYGYSVVNGGEFNFPTSDCNQEYINAVFGDNIHPTEKVGYPMYANHLLTILL